MFVGCWGLKPRWLLVCLVVSCSLVRRQRCGCCKGSNKKVCTECREVCTECALSSGVGYEGGGLCRGWEALAGYLGGLSCRQGRGVSHTPPERHHRWRIHVPHSTPSGPPKRAYAIRPYSRVPGHTRRRPQTPPKQRGRHAPSETPVSAACWRTTRHSQEYYFPHYMRRTDPATGLVTGVVHMAPPSTMPPSVGGCGRRRSLLGTRKACTRPYSQASADAPGQALPRGAPRHLRTTESGLRPRLGRLVLHRLFPDRHRGLLLRTDGRGLDHRGRWRYRQLRSQCQSDGTAWCARRIYRRQGDDGRNGCRTRQCRRTDQGFTH